MREARALVALFAVLAFTSLGGAESSAPLQDLESPHRIVAIGDVHGSFEGLVTILTATGLIDGDQHWIGGNATLVQLGDLLDRGADVRPVMDLLIRLQSESESVGGQVICLLGNHEAMNLLGVSDYINPQVYETFISTESNSTRKAAWRQQTKLWYRRAKAAQQVIPEISTEFKEKWLDANVLGSFDYVDAFAADGEYGRWLRSCPIAVVIEETLFIHGGLSPELRGMSAEDINRRAADELEAFDAARNALAEKKLVLRWASIREVEREALAEIERLSTELSERQRSKPAVVAYRDVLERLGDWAKWLLISDGGPVWSRAVAQWDENERGHEMVELISEAGVRRMVVGHTPQASANIQMRFDKHAFLIDTGMSEPQIGGRPSALEIIGDAITAIYPDERSELVVPGAAAEDDGPVPEPEDCHSSEPPKASKMLADCG